MVDTTYQNSKMWLCHEVPVQTHFYSLSAEDILSYVVESYLAPHGVTLGDVSTTGALYTYLTTFRTPGYILDDLAAHEGRVWWLDDRDRLNFLRPSQIWARQREGLLAHILRTRNSELHYPNIVHFTECARCAEAIANRPYLHFQAENFTYGQIMGGDLCEQCSRVLLEFLTY